MKFRILIFLIVSALLTNCGNNSESSDINSKSKVKLAEKFGLTLYELEHGIGPVKENIELGSFDQSLAENGKKLFTEKCSQCHKMDERYTGPALRDVTNKRTPEYILNMILNPEEMTKKHPEAKKMLAIYANQMTFQNVSEEDARAIFEYLRMESNH